MTRKQRLTLKMKAKELSLEEIGNGIGKYHALLFMNPTHPRSTQRMRELVMLKLELKTRGFELNTHPMLLGVVLELVPAEPILLALPDYKAMADCSINIPSVDDIINAPLPKDLPKHGYLHA